MTSRHDQLALQDRLREVLGPDPAATLMAMLPQRDELATKNDLLEVRDELRGELAAFRVELKGEMSELRSDMNGFIRTFIAVQAATVVGATGIVYALVRLT